MVSLPWAMLAEATPTYADDKGVDLDYDGVQIRYVPAGGMTPQDYEFFEVEPPVADPPTQFHDRWYHGAGEATPKSFPWGPLSGTQEQLAAWMFPDQHGQKKPDARPLHRRAKNGKAIWVRKIHRTLYEVWFRHESEYSRAVQCRESE